MLFKGLCLAEITLGVSTDSEEGKAKSLKLERSTSQSSGEKREAAKETREQQCEARGQSGKRGVWEGQEQGAPEERATVPGGPIK